MAATIKKYKILLIVSGAVLLGSYLTNYQKEKGLASPAPSPPIETTQPQPSPASNPKIQSLIETEVAKLPGSYGVYIKDLKNGATYTNSADKSFTSASIYKLAVMYKTYDEIEKGNIKKEDVLSQNKVKLDTTVSGNPDAKNTDQVIVMDVKNALNLMITVSDNYAALLLAESLGWQNIDAFLKQNDIQNFTLVGKDSPATTAHATALILEKIYTQKAVSAQASSEMLTLLLAQTRNDRIPRYLPTEVKVAHKTGELDNTRNDAGIIFGKKSDYIFVILSQTPKPEDAVENIALLSKDIFNALENPNSLK